MDHPDQLRLPSRTCDACGEAELTQFSDLGRIPVETGRHFATQAEALASPTGRVVLGYCPVCGYVRNLAFDPTLIDPSAPTDMNLYHSATFRAFSSEVVQELAARLPLAGRRVVEVGCAQGEFLRHLCQVAGCAGIGYDPSYTGPVGADGTGVELWDTPAPVEQGLPQFDLLVSRFTLEHVTDPYQFLLALRRQAADGTAAHLQVPDAAYDLATAGWEVIYPHVSYFAEPALRRIAERAGWSVTDSRSHFSGLIRSLDLIAGSAPTGSVDLETARQRLLAAVSGFDQRHHTERRRWRETIDRLVDQGARPVLWGAGSRGVQWLTAADPHRRLTAVVDVNPAKWGRYLPMTGHRVDEPASLRGSGTQAVVITNPVYREEIARGLADLDLYPDILVA